MMRVLQALMESYNLYLITQSPVAVCLNEGLGTQEGL